MGSGYIIYYKRRRKEMSSRTDKYARMSDQLNKAKQQRIKDVQDEWKSQFVDRKS